MSGNEYTVIGSTDDKRLKKLDDATDVGRSNADERSRSFNLESVDQYPHDSQPSKKGHTSKSRNDRHHSRHRSDGKDRDKKKSSKKRTRNKDGKYYSDDDDCDDSDVSSSNAYDSSSHSVQDDDRRRRHRHDKEKKKKHESKKHKKDDDRSKDRKSKKKKHKKERRSNDRATTESLVTAAPTFGQYGIIKASDMAKMQRTFEVWLSEVHGVHISSSNIPRYELQQYFDTYREDYNTATLPHIKYYDYDKWELEEHETQKRELEQSGQTSSALINDERNHAKEMQRQAMQKKEAALQFVAATMNTTKVKEMQHQKQLQSQMQMAFKMGDHETYRKIKEKLQPPDK